MDVVVYDKVGKEADKLATYLLGTYPQETILDADIASFSDGADGIPVKAFKANIKPAQDLHGYGNPWPAGGGKNLLDDTIRSTGSGGYVFFNNASTFNVKTLTLPAGTYTFSVSYSSAFATTKAHLNVYDVVNRTEVAKQYNATQVTFTTSETLDVCLYVQNSGLTSADILTAQLEDGSVATDYRPYSNICPISGWTGLSGARTGKNLFNIDSVSPSVRVSGTDTVSLEGWARNLMTGRDSTVITPEEALTFPTLPAGNYVLSFKVLSGASAKNVRLSAVSTIDGSITELTLGQPYVASDGTKYFLFSCDSVIHYALFGVTTNVTAIVGNIQIERGTSFTTYEPYQGQTISVSWATEAGTVYMGTLDLVTGKLTVDYALVTLNGTNYPTGTAATSAATATALVQVLVPNIALVNEYDSGKVISDYLPSTTDYTIYRNASPAVAIHYDMSAPNRRLWFRLPNITTEADAKTYLANNPLTVVYEISNPQTYQLDPVTVETLYGGNTIYVDCGSVDLTYRANIGDYINNAITTAVANALNA